MLELRCRRHNDLDPDLSSQQGASEFRKWHLRFVPSCSKIDRRCASTVGRKPCKRRGISRVPRREGALPLARWRWSGSLPRRFRRKRRAASRAWWRRASSRSWCRNGSCSRKGRWARRTAGFISPISVQSHLPPRYELGGQYRSRAEQRRQRPGGDARGRFAGGGRRRQTHQQTQPRRHRHDRHRGSEGKPFLAPNDLILDAKGGMYFSDPGPRPVVPGRTAYVYYLPPGAKQPIVIDDKIARPNGLTLTRDGKTLIVDDTLNPTVYAYDVEPDGSVKNKRTFAQLRDIPEGKESGADGMALDREDRVYITTLTGVQVFDAAGKYLGTIKVARQPANVGFAGPDKRVLFITAREGLYRLDTLAQGPDRVGK